MKTLKKTLALALALVMALSLCSVAFAADSNFDGYTDVETIGDAYVEAVDVLMGLGIVNGMSATEIGPEGYYTRAQAAKIATYLAVGPEVAEMLPAAESFEDVPTTHWASKYIAYCAGKNILNGTTATTYDPEAYVTGYQFAKMVLAAAGYGANDEFVGGDWAIETAQLALRADIDLFAGDAKAATNDPITRQQAMLIAFNALDLDHVSYSKLLEQYVGAGTAFYGSDISATTPADNKLGIAVYNWNDAEGEAISDSYAVDTYVASFAAGATYGEIAAATKVKEDSTATIKFYTNGKAGDSYVVADYIDDKTNKVPAGITADLYKDADTGNFKLLTTVTYVVEANAGTKVTDETSKYYGQYEFTLGSYSAAKLYGAAEDSYKGFYAVVPARDAAACTEFLSIEKVAPLAAKATKYNSTAGTITVDGTAYPVAYVAGDIYSSASFTTAMNYYVYDGALYVIDSIDSVDETVSLDGYVYLTKVQADFELATSGSMITEGTADKVAAKAEIYALDGTKSVVDIALYTVKNDAGAITGYKYFSEDGTTVAQDTNATVNAWVGYTVADGAYTFYDLADFDDFAAVVTSDGWAKKEVNEVEGRYTNSATQYTYINVKDETVKTVTGIANIEIADGTTVLATYAGEKSTTVANLYVIKFTTDVTDTAASYAYVAAQGATVNGGVEYTVYVDGAVATYIAPSEALTPEVGKVYANMTVNSKNVITALGTDKGEVEAAVANDKVTVADATYFVNATEGTEMYVDGVVIYDITEGTAGTAATIAVGDYVKVLDGGKVIYIVDAPEA